jgi:hypothetical protein
MTAESLNIPKTVVLWIMKEDLGNRKLCARFFLVTRLRAHQQSCVCQFLTRTNVTTLYHPQYSPAVSPPDYFLFPKLKMKLTGRHFADVAEIQEVVTDELKEVQKEEFSAGFQKLYNRAKSLRICQWSLFRIKKKLCLPHVPLIFKKNQS